MDNIDTLTQTCQSQIEPKIVRAIIDIESAGNPLALAVVKIPRFYQPTTLRKAIKIVKILYKHHYSFSAGLMQINSGNYKYYKLNAYDIFDPCKNIEVGTDIYNNCLRRAKKEHPKKKGIEIYQLSASCYFSGDFTTGYKLPENTSYVERFTRSLDKYNLKF